MSAFFNIAKAIVGAGSFSLPWVLENEGLLGGTLTIVVSAALASYTITSLIDSKNIVERNTDRSGSSYVDIAREVLGKETANFVFAMTVLASMLVCSSYIAFVGSTLQTLAAQEGSMLHQILPDLSKDQVQVAALGFVLPVSWLKSFEFLSFTSTLGTLSVLAALITVLIDGLGHQGSLDAVTSALSSLPLWPDSFESYFKSLGSVLFLFCVNFLVFPIERSMKNPGNFDRAVNGAVWTTASVNILFAALAFSFYGQETQDIVLNNLGPGNVLTAVKLLLCADLLLTYPLVFAAGREILENAFLNDEEEGEEGNRTEGLPVVSGKKALLRTSLVGFTLLVGNLKGFGLITNIAGGLAQGSLAFIIPPALQLQLKPSTRISQLMASALILLGLLSSGLTTYEAIVSS